MGERRRCVGGLTDPIYHGLATGLCPVCGEFVALINTGQTVRHFAPPSGRRVPS